MCCGFCFFPFFFVGRRRCFHGLGLLTELLRLLLERRPLFRPLLGLLVLGEREYLCLSRRHLLGVRERERERDGDGELEP